LYPRLEAAGAHESAIGNSDRKRNTKDTKNSYFKVRVTEGKGNGDNEKRERDNTYVLLISMRFPSLSLWLWLWAALPWALELPHFREVPAWTKKGLSLKIRRAVEAPPSGNNQRNYNVYSMERCFGRLA